MPGLLAVVLFQLALAPAPTPAQLLFESGQYAKLAATVVGSARPTPADLYLAALSYQKLRRQPDAARLFALLSNRGAEDPWGSIGRSAIDLVQGDLDRALAEATAATTLKDDLAEAHYQQGLVLATRNEFPAAAAAFERATTVNPSFAYAYYYAGLAYYSAKRPDRMAVYFETFLRLAPKAPNRGQVTSIMRAVRGR